MNLCNNYDHISYRFVSVDPVRNRDEAIANPQLWNLYAYCNNNPITYLDPDGNSHVEPSDWAVYRTLYNEVSPEFANSYLKQQALGCTEFIAGEAIGAGLTAGVVKGLKWLSKVRWLFKSSKSVGFRSFSAFKRAMGSAGKRMHWHHIVESHQVGEFGAEAIHSTEDIISIPEKIHNKISGYYSSIDSFTEGLTVRKWLGTKSFKEQYKFGLDVIKKFGGK